MAAPFVAATRQVVSSLDVSFLFTSTMPDFVAAIVVAVVIIVGVPFVLMHGCIFNLLLSMLFNFCCYFRFIIFVVFNQCLLQAIVVVVVIAFVVIFATVISLKELRQSITKFFLLVVVVSGAGGNASGDDVSAVDLPLLL